jgi:hypothetical protein
MIHNPLLTPDYQERVQRKWKNVIAAGGDIQDSNIALTTALVLENTQREFERPKAGSRLNESFAGTIQSNGGMGAQSGAAGDGGGQLGANHDYTDYNNDSRMPNIIIPTLRRIFPELIAHNVVGVQPMNGPVGFAFALRAKYGINRNGTAGDATADNDEIGYNTIHSDFTGKAGMGDADNTEFYSDIKNDYPGGGALNEAGDADLDGDANPVTNPVSKGDMWAAFAGSTDANLHGQGATLGESEWWKIGDDMPMTKFSLEKGTVEAKSRKLGAHWSLELEEDMMNMHGVSANSEMVDIMSYEIQAEIDRQLIGEMVKASLNGDVGLHYSAWDPATADGRNQIERIGTLYTQVLIKGQQIAVNSRRGPANFAFADTTTCSLLERLGDFQVDAEGGKVQTIKNTVGITKAGSIRHGSVNLYRDTFAGGNYVLLGYKGPTPYDSGVIYCPYIPVQMMQAQGTQDFSPRMGIRTRYGVLNNLFGAANFYHFIKVNGINGAVQGDASNNRVFTF